MGAESVFHTFNLACDEGVVVVFFVLKTVSMSSNVLVGVDVEGGLGDIALEGLSEGEEGCDGVVLPERLVALVGIEQAVLDLWGVSE